MDESRAELVSGMEALSLATMSVRRLWSMEAQPVTFRCCVIICDLKVVLGKSDGKTGYVSVRLLPARSFLSYRRKYRLIMI